MLRHFGHARARDGGVANDQTIAQASQRNLRNGFLLRIGQIRCNLDKDGLARNAIAIAEKALSDAGVECESHARPWIGHGIDPEGIEAAVAFLKNHLG